jgi:hypothetical protein
MLCKLLFLFICIGIPKSDAIVVDFDDQNEERCDAILPLTNDGAAISNVSTIQQSSHGDAIALVLAVVVII